MNSDKPSQDLPVDMEAGSFLQTRREFVTRASVLALVGMIGENAIAATKMTKGQQSFYKFFTEVVPKEKAVWKELFSSKSEREFAMMAVKAGKNMRFEFSGQDVLAVMKMGREPKSDLLSDRELTTIALGDAASKGTSWCDGSWDHTNGLATDTACCP